MFLYISEKHTWTVLQKLYVILVFILDVTRTLFWICKRLEHFLAWNNTYREKSVGKAVIREMQGGDNDKDKYKYKDNDKDTLRTPPKSKPRDL